MDRNENMNAFYSIEDECSGCELVRVVEMCLAVRGFMEGRRDPSCNRNYHIYWTGFKKISVRK